MPTTTAFKCYASLPGLSSPRLYTVGWIAALDKELAAAIALLDERHRKPDNFKKHPKDANAYTWGRIGEHNVVIASLAAGRYGTVSAATTAWSLISSLPHLRFGLMVGIGAGIPRLAEGIDIRLGDVVVSHPTGTCPGVVQYDLGKFGERGKFERVGQLNPPPEVLLKGIASLKASHLMEESRIPEIVEEMVRRYPKMRDQEPGFVYQGAHNDRLFETPSVHVHTDMPDGNSLVLDKDGVCAKCDPSMEIKRKQRSPRPVIHYGIIASGNSVIKDGISRIDVLQRLEDKCICFEMEAAGLMNSFPCLVIRGVCDYADGHKNDQWQNYAAAVAAAFAKELLETMDGEDVERSPEIEVQELGQQIAELASTNKETHSAVHHLVTNSHFQELEQWLAPPNPSINHNHALSQRHEGSGKWFLDSRKYSSWKAGHGLFLWLYGIPGSGKTILTSTVINDLEKDEETDPLYFYFNFTDTAKQSFEKALHSLIVQLYRKRPHCQRHLDLLYTYCDNGMRQPSIDMLCKTFQAMVKQSGQIWIVLDALDECQTRREYPAMGLLQWIKSLVSSAGDQPNVHLLITSRPEQDIKSAIETWASNEHMIPLQSDLVADDITAYIQTRVRGHGGLKRWRSRPEVQEEIETALETRANGMFRWVTCQLSALENCFDYPSLQKALSSLPRTLDETYGRVLASLPPEHEAHTRRILQFLTYSRRPLSIQEAVDAIATDIEARPRFDRKNRMPVPEEISRYCSSLVVVVTRHDYETGLAVKELQLAHFSVKEYLLSGRLQVSFAKDFEETTARGIIAQVCLGYLLELDQGPSPAELRRSYWLAQYAARFWIHHAAIAERSSREVRDLIEDFFSSKCTHENWCRLYDPDLPWEEEPEEEPKQDGPQLASPLYYASLAGLTSYVTTLLDKGIDSNTEAGFYGYPLQVASVGGHDELVLLLLGKGADVNACGGFYGHALQAASSTGHERVVKLLIDNGADIEAQGGYYGNALQAASSRGHETIVLELLNNGASVSSEGGHLGTPLQAASSGGHEAIINILLDKGADINIKAGHFGTALQAAAFGGHQNIIKMLLDKGADVNAKAGNFGNALQAASFSGNEGVVQLLLDKGADANAEGGWLGSAVQAALCQGHGEIVQMLNARIGSHSRSKGSTNPPPKRQKTR